MKKVLFILLGLVAAGVLGLVAMCQYTGSKLKPYVEEILVDCDAGRFHEAYARAGEAGQQKWSEPAFQAYMEAVKQRLGAYKGLGAVKGFSAHTAAGSDATASVTVEVQFEKGTENGRFDFVKVGETYRWTDIQIPALGKTKADPEQLQPTATALIQLLGDGELVALYERFTPELKAGWPAEKYQADMTPLREKLGAFEGASHVSTTPTDDGQSVLMKATFANATMLAKIHLISRDGIWQPLGFTFKSE